MKKIFFLLVICVLSNNITAQVYLPSAPVTNAIPGSNVFLDASTSFSPEASASNSEGKGIVIPRVDLVNFEFDLTYLDGGTFPSYLDGMVVYNGVSGTTLTTGNRSSTATDVIPGFYYFSNPDGQANGNITGGIWTPLGGPSATIKSKTVTSTATGTSATLDLGTTIIAASEVNTFLGAKIYDASGNLVMTADSEYAKTTNILTTGNGFIAQALPAATYTVVVDYK